jgi:hypothetical protein
LINAGNGDILCKDLKLFILHEELKQIVFWTSRTNKYILKVLF